MRVYTHATDEKVQKQMKNLEREMQLFEVTFQFYRNASRHRV